jgi:glucose/arabinose dehydrogenase
VGSLKAGSLYRVRLKTTAAPEVERLLVNFGRIRDVAVGASGDIYLAVEHGENGSLWRLSPRP